jgi:hypothetical protein
MKVSTIGYVSVLDATGERVSGRQEVELYREPTPETVQVRWRGEALSWPNERLYTDEELRIRVAENCMVTYVLVEMGDWSFRLLMEDPARCRAGDTVHFEGVDLTVAGRMFEEKEG